MSKEGRHGVILTKEGTFESVRMPKDQKVRIGEEIHTGAPFVLRIPKSALSALAACLLLFAGLGAFGLENQNKAVAAYVSFDINPSFEAGLNRELHIVSIHPMNKDGSKLLNQVKDYKNLSLDEFTRKVATALDKDGYFNQQPHIVVSVTLTSNFSGKTAKPLETMISMGLEPIYETPDFKNNKGVLQVIKTSMKTHDQAKKLGFTAGKYSLYESAAKKSNTVTPEKAKAMTVRELINVAHPEVPAANKGPKAVLSPTQRVDSNELKGKKGFVPRSFHSNQRKQENPTKIVIPHKTGTSKIPVTHQKDKQSTKAVQNVEKQEEHGHRELHWQQKERHSDHANHGWQKKMVKKKDGSHDKEKESFPFKSTAKWN
jgi:hypothetical protein